MPAKKPTDPKKQTSETIQSKIKKLEQDVSTLTAELQEKNDRYLRTLADYQNYQKRMEKELIIQKEDLKKKYLLELLDFHELLKKAAEDPDPKEGLKLLIANFDKFFEKEGVTFIECKGKPFDHSIHHAITIMEKDDCVDDTILDEVKKGYMLGGKLLRPSQVVVGKKKS